MDKIEDQTVHEASITSRRRIIFKVEDSHSPKLPEILRQRYCERRRCPFLNNFKCGGPNWKGVRPSLIGMEIRSHVTVENIEGPIGVEPPRCYIEEAFEEGKLDTTELKLADFKILF